MSAENSNRKREGTSPKSPRDPGAARTPPSPLAAWDFAPACFTFFAGLAFLVLWTWGIARWYAPDTAKLILEASKLLTPPAAQALAPEPVERLQYVSSLLLMPLFLLGCLCASGWFYQNSPERNRRLYRRGATLLLLAVTAATPVLFYLALKKSDFLYVRAGVLFTHLGTYTLLLFPCAALLAVSVEKRWGRRLSKTALYSVSAYIFAIVFFSALFDRDSISLWTHHLNPVIYPLAQVMAGKTLLVDCAPLYGLYPHFLQPVFEAFPLSVYSFTFFMAVLLTASLAALWLYLRMLIRNDVVFLSGFSAAVFYSYAGTKSLLSEARPDPYFQYAPIRMLFPCLLLALCSLYLRGIGKRWVYYATFLTSAIATLWNPDTGVVVFGAWLLLLGYTELSQNPWRASILPILVHFLAAFGSLFLVYGGYALFAFLRSGAWPDWRMSAGYYTLFSHYGYFMLPMCGLPHMWGIVVGIYVGAMVFALDGLLRKEPSLLCGNLFLLTILGAGLFAYYQGRSHDLCLIPLLCIPILIITLLADHLLTGMKNSPVSYWKFFPLGALFFYFCASAIPSLFTGSSVFLGWIYEGCSASPAGSQGMHSRNIEFIRKHTKRGEKIFILIGDDLEGMYYAESATASVLTLPSSTDWFFLRDHLQIVRFLQGNRSTKLFVVPGQMAGIQELFRQSYRLAAQENQTGLTMLLPASTNESLVTPPP